MRQDPNKATDICHILIIENETLVALDLQTLLREAGATSFAFATTEADAMFQAHLHRPDIITSGVCLATGTGPAAIQSIRDRFGMIPVLFISGTPEDDIPREPGDAVFHKPFDHVEISAAFQDILDRRTTTVDGDAV